MFQFYFRTILRDMKIFHISKDGSEIELKHCASSKTSVKSSRKYFVHINWIKLSTNPSWLDSSIGRAAVLETRRCEFKSRSRQRIFRCRLQCQINMNRVFHISEDGSEINCTTNEIFQINTFLIPAKHLLCV